MPAVTDLTELDQYQTDLEMLGYDWWGELGLPRRRYCTKTESVTNRRLIQLHCYAEGSPEITRHRAFRDYLRENPRIAAAYDQENLAVRACILTIHTPMATARKHGSRRLKQKHLPGWLGR
jgi:GrpB-like predicted nucleotidyltransferase (UPF0157 family)